MSDPGSSIRQRNNEKGSKDDVQLENRDNVTTKKNLGVLHYLFKNHVWVFTMWLIPISICYDLYWWVHAKYSQWSNIWKPYVRHATKVEDVQKQVLEWKKSGCRQPMCTGRSGDKSITMQRLMYKDRMYKINIDMADILEIDIKEGYVRVEPYVTVGRLNDFLISRGWTLPVVPELDDLTIGGLVMGGGIESTSHKYGFFHFNVCRRFEVVLGDGTVQWASPKENEDLFVALQFSYGTLGFLVAIDVDIVPYKPYIELTYHNVTSLDQVVEKFTEVTNNSEIDSVEGIMYSLNTGVIMSGKFVDKVPKGGCYNPLGRWYKPWFYKHVELYMNDKVQEMGNIEYVPTRDFFHRQNRAYFWMFPLVAPFANHWLFRYLLGWAMPIKFSLLKQLRNLVSEDSEMVDSNSVLQDYIIKLDDLKDCLKLVHEEQQVYPIWLCPAKYWDKWNLKILSQQKDECYVDVGVYGLSPIPDFDPVASQRCLEKFAMKNQGMAALYAETQLTEEEFIEMFNFDGRIDFHYKMREKLKCEKAFPTIYEKISRLGRGKNLMNL